MEKLAQLLWGMPMMVLLLAVGILLSVKTGFVQIRELPAALRQVGKSLKSEDRTAFRAMCTALAATVGTGNIAGVAGAIALGGPGAVFWMWVAAFFGMATKYAEVVLAMRWRTKGGKGGPMYYIRCGMGEQYRWLAAVFAFCAVLASCGMGNITQVHTISSAVAAVVPGVSGRSAALVTGLVTAALVAAVTLGGAKRVGQVTEKLVPVMAGIYLAAMVAVLAIHYRRIDDVFVMVLKGAFCPQAVAGGGVGIGLRQAVRWGVSRGVFSNEAGLGSAPIAHASSRLSPQEQGLLGIFEVFFDTIVLCSLTAFAILSCDLKIDYGNPAGAELATGALARVFGSAAPWISAAVLGLLSLATVISWQLYGARCAEYLWGSAGVQGYSLCYIAVVVLGATMDLSGAWAVADVCNGLMCLPNLAALLYLGRRTNLTGKQADLWLDNKWNFPDNGS